MVAVDSAWWCNLYPPGQFTVTNTVAVLDKLECTPEGAVACYGPGGFHWMSTVGDLSTMYAEIDPALACDKAEEAISHLPHGQGGGRPHGLSW